MTVGPVRAFPLTAPGDGLSLVGAFNTESDGLARRFAVTTISSSTGRMPSAWYLPTSAA